MITNNRNPLELWLRRRQRIMRVLLLSFLLVFLVAIPVQAAATSSPWDLVSGVTRQVQAPIKKSKRHHRPQKKNHQPAFVSRLQSQASFVWNQCWNDGNNDTEEDTDNQKSADNNQHAAESSSNNNNNNNNNNNEDDDDNNEKGILSRLATTTNAKNLTRALSEKLQSLPVIQQLSNATGPMDFLGALADRVLSEESATAVRTIRTILENMEDHGIVDVFSKYPPQDVAASLYAFYRLQRAARYYELEQEIQDHNQPPDLVPLLEELSHYVVYATAAYGWKMDLAFKGKLHLGDEHALVRKTGIDKEDIIKLSLKSKAHLPVFFLVRDRKRKALVLCVRGTWSARDVLTDLCCTAEEYEAPVCHTEERDTTSSISSSLSSSLSNLRSTVSASSNSTSQQKEEEEVPQRYCAHHGMLEAAMAVAIDMEDVIAEELEANPDFSLVLVGHSMGAGCASLLATFWEKKFNNIKTYLFGGPCVAPLDSHPTNVSSIINVISEGDPFRCLSLGHIADLSAAVARLCDEPELRRVLLTRTDGNVEEMHNDDLEFCFETMQEFHREVMTHADKMFPPGRILHVTRRKPANEESDDTDNGKKPQSNSNGQEVSIHEVGPEFFRDLVVGPRMLDISRHLPSLYEDTLRDLLEREEHIESSAEDEYR